jgi:YD repeat-containing protein
MAKNFIQLIALLLLLTGCGKDSSNNPSPAEANCKILESKTSYGTTTTYTYDGNGRLKKVEAIPSDLSQGIDLYELDYDASGRLMKVNTLVPSIRRDEQAFYEYNSAGQAVKMNLHYRNTDGDYVPMYYYVFEYAKVDELRQRRRYYIGETEDLLVQTEDFFYEEGLQTKVQIMNHVEERENRIILLEYDAKNSPDYEDRLLKLRGYGYPHKHNITKLTTTNWSGQSFTEQSYEHAYTYSKEGYPSSNRRTFLSGRNWSYTYTYSCQ